VIWARRIGQAGWYSSGAGVAELADGRIVVAAGELPPSDDVGLVFLDASGNGCADCSFPTTVTGRDTSLLFQPLPCLDLPFGADGPWEGSSEDYASSDLLVCGPVGIPSSPEPKATMMVPLDAGRWTLRTPDAWVDMQVRDAAGRLLMSRSRSHDGTVLDLSGFSTGVYVLDVHTASGGNTGIRIFVAD
jgi:hypothetical protein